MWINSCKHKTALSLLFCNRCCHDGSAVGYAEILKLIAYIFSHKDCYDWTTNYIWQTLIGFIRHHRDCL